MRTSFSRFDFGAAALAWLIWGSLLLYGQQVGTPIPTRQGEPYHLRVYEDLVEVPTLVLNRLYADLPNEKKESFMIRLDSGPGFHPSAVRLEGDDPISIALLVDAGGSVSPGTIDLLREALARSPAPWLTSRDKVTIYAVDCGLFRAPEITAMPSPAGLQRDLAAALTNPGLHRSEEGPAAGCGSSRHLWDAIGAVAGQMGTMPGRRVMLVLTNGEDSGSVNSWERVREYANGNGVAIFGIRPPLEVPSPMRPSRFGDTPNRRVEDPFSLLCAGTGGMVFGVSRHGMVLTLHRAITVVRNRYVLYFPRPGNDSAGRHRIDVTVADQTAIVRPTGVAFPPRNRSSEQDPGTVPNDPTRLPELGKRRNLQPSPED